MASQIDAAELIRAKHGSAQRFNKLVNKLRKKGVSDREIVAAMAASPLLIDRLGAALPVRRIRYGRT